jgi:hypothetical protein
VLPFRVESESFEESFEVPPNHQSENRVAPSAPAAGTRSRR